MTPSELGFHFVLVALGYLVGDFVSGGYSERIGIEPMMMWGGLIGASGVAASLELVLLLLPNAAFLYYPMAITGVSNGMVSPNATAGALSVRRNLAGSASGICGLLQIGAGALLAMRVGAFITVEKNAILLFVVMFAPSLFGAILAWVMRRQSSHAQPAPIEN